MGPARPIIAGTFSFAARLSFIPVDPQNQLHVLIDGIAVDQIEILEDVADIFFSVLFKISGQIMTGFAAVYVKLPFFVGVQTGNYIEQSRLAASRLACLITTNSPTSNSRFTLGKSAGDHAFAVVKFRYVF